MNTSTRTSLEERMSDTTKLSSTDKADYCKDAYLAMRKARNYIRDVERLLDLDINLEHNRMYTDMETLWHRMFKMMQDLRDLQDEFSKEKEG